MRESVCAATDAARHTANRDMNIFFIGPSPLSMPGVPAGRQIHTCDKLGRAMAKNFEIVCPCCEATVVVDRLSGEVLLHKAKEKRTTGSLESMVAGLDAQKSELEKKFEREMAGQKDRSRILDEKFKEAMERAEKSDKPVVNPMDLD